jgi:NADH-quinone oxidoreductase subunit H
MDFLRNPLGVVGEAIKTALLGAGLAPGAVDVILMAIGVIIIATFCLVLPLFLIWFERRVVARMQDRSGPNRVGPQGSLQTIADALKLMTKEDITPIGADKVVYNLSPILAVVAVITMWAVVPFAPAIIGTDLNVGALYIAAVGSLGTLAIMMGGWASNNKYALLGAFRTVAQLVSYEAPMILSLFVPVLLARSMGMMDIVNEQHMWFIVLAPIPAFIFFVTSVAEVGRAPFDLLEAESEIVAGFHIEYSGMKFAMFFVAEFMHAFTVGALVAVLYLGGWRGPWATEVPILGLLYFMLKSFAGYFVVILIRATLPRIRIDHMLDLNWKFLVPVALASIVVIMLADKIGASLAGMPFETWASAAYMWPRGALLLLANLALGYVILNLLRGSAQKMRAEDEAPAAHDAEHGHEARGHGDHAAHAPAH